MRRSALTFLLLISLAALAGCGFKLRGHSALPFTNAYVEARPNSLLAGPLRQSLAASGKLSSSKIESAVIILLSGEAREKNVLSLSGTGKVREYRLIHRVTVSAMDAANRELLAPSLIRLSRDFSYDDQQIMAKEAEETMLHREMEQDILRQILRRLGYIQRP